MTVSSSDPLLPPNVYGAPTVVSWTPNGWDYSHPTSSAYGNNFMFQGRDYFSSFGVYDYRHRFYQPTLGRFIEQDPSGFEAGDMNLLRYCADDPVDGSDPTGLQAQRDETPRDYFWEMAVHFDSGNSSQGTFREVMSRLGGGNDGLERADASRAQGPSAAQGRARILTAQKRFYAAKNLRKFDRAPAKTFGKSAVYVPAQTLENAPAIDTSLNSEQLYTQGHLRGGRTLASGRAAGLTSKTDSGYRIYTAHDAARDPARTYAHELANKLSGELTGSTRAFGDAQNPPHGDPDTGAVLERNMYGDD